MKNITYESVFNKLGRKCAYKLKDVEYANITYDILHTDEVLSMIEFMQHGNTSCLEHSINVSYYSYKLAKKINLDYVSAARGALLHDFFLYDWHTTELAKFPNILKMHGFQHPKIAERNANKYFSITKLEADIISKHMFPLTFYSIPKYAETWLVSTIDKLSSTYEIITPKLPSPLISRLNS